MNRAVKFSSRYSTVLDVVEFDASLYEASNSFHIGEMNFTSPSLNAAMKFGIVLGSFSLPTMRPGLIHVKFNLNL